MRWRLLTTTSRARPSAPGRPAALDLAAASDTGTVQDDDFTSDTPPTITGTAEEGCTVTVFANAAVMGTAVVMGGSWSLTPLVPLRAGVYAITAKATDAAGNVGVASSKSGGGSLMITIDTTTTIRTVPDLVSADDTGWSSTDNKTRTSSPTFGGSAEPFSTVALTADGAPVGSAVADPKGGWRIKVEGSLPEGKSSLRSRAVDRAGNASVSSLALSITINTTAFPKPASLALAAASDSGLKGDTTTNVFAPSFTGTASAGARVNLYRVEAGSGASPMLLGTGTVGSATSNGLGTWSFATGSTQTFSEKSLAHHRQENRRVRKRTFRTGAAAGESLSTTRPGT